MIKWADYIITKMKSEDMKGKRTLILAEMHHDTDDLDKVGSWYSRDKLISLISIGNSVCLAFKKNNLWVPGPDIRPYKINDHYYLKTLDSNDGIEEDSLPQKNILQLGSLKR